MQRRNSYLLLAVLGVGVFLAGLELMVTAVALPQILATVADWTDLRKASWIINGYLLMYVVTMPLAGRLTDTWGARRLFLAALTVFTIGSFLAGIAQDLDQLIAARLVQAVGGGAIIPVATAAASHLFEGPARPRALGIIGALTFLGMAAGPFVGAAVLETVHPETALAQMGVSGGPLVTSVAPAWRWVFYVNVPIGICGLAIAWAASAGWDTRRVPARVDLLGALVFTVGLTGILFGTTLVGSGDEVFGVPTPLAVGALLGIGGLSLLAAIVHGLRRPDPFLDPRLFADRVFSSAALISLLTGYGMATAIVGGAVFVDRVLYGGPAEQRVVLGALAGAMALGALLSGFLRRIGRRLRLRLRADGHAAVHRRGGSRGQASVRGGIGHRDRGPDDRHGRGHGCAHGVRLHHDHAHLQRDLRLGRRLQAVHSRIPARSTAARWAGGAGTRKLGRQQGGLDPGGRLPGGCGGHARRGRPGPGASSEKAPRGGNRG
jgi:MFS family permease